VARRPASRLDRVSFPREPSPSRYLLPDPTDACSDDVVAVGADLEPGTILQGYRRGLFPMHLPDGQLGWWSPVRRGIIPLDRLRISRSLRKSLRRYRVFIDTAFEAVIGQCADPMRPGAWITDDIKKAYIRLHHLGWAHSVEAWDREGNLAGGLYGVAIGGAFFGESMFYEQRDASKVALTGLVISMRTGGATLLDVQWATEHLRSLGAVEVPRVDYLELVSKALELPLPPVWHRRQS